MKKRMGFVSNSSSASFIIKFSSDKSWSDIEPYIINSEENLINTWNEHKVITYNWAEVFKNKSAKEEIEIDGDPRRNDFVDNKDGTYILNSDTTMFNDWTDMPYWKFIRALDEDKLSDLKLMSITQIEDEYEFCDKEVKFNKNTWEYEDFVSDTNNSYYKKLTQAERDKIIDSQHNTDMSYKEYLADMNSPMTEEEKIEIAKYKLNK